MTAKVSLKRLEDFFDQDNYIDTFHEATKIFLTDSPSDQKHVWDTYILKHDMIFKFCMQAYKEDINRLIEYADGFLEDRIIDKIERPADKESMKLILYAGKTAAYARLGQIDDMKSCLKEALDKAWSFCKGKTP